MAKDKNEGGGAGILVSGIIFLTIGIANFFGTNQKVEVRTVYYEVYDDAPSGGASSGGGATAEAQPQLDEEGNPIPQDTTEGAYDPNMSGGPAGEGVGTNREWRGYVQTSEEALKSQLPPQAQHLASSFIEAGQKYNIDPLFLMSISAHETGNWTSNAFRNKNNAMGISNNQGVVNQSSHRESIMQMGASLAGAPGTNGYYNNARTVGQVGQIYAPVGATNDPRGLNGYWPTTVGNIYDKYSNILR